MCRYLLFVIFCIDALFVDAQWQWINPVPQGNELRDVCMTPSGNIIAVGSSKTIITSKDHGITWQVINLGNYPKIHFYSVFFVNDSLGWINGKNFILKTTDGGMTWNTVYYTDDQILLNICFINPMQGWAVGQAGIIIRTIDGGNSWQTLSSGCTDNLNSVCFADENIGVAVGEKGTILYTEKGGQTWEKIPIDIDADFFRVLCLNWHCMYAVGSDGQVLFSVDGRQWQSRSVGIHRHLYDVYFNNADTGWVCGYSKDVYFTTDGGLTWTPQWIGGSGDYPDYFAICSDGTDELWTVGRYGNIVGTFDGGENWNHINQGLRTSFKRVSFVDENKGWLLDNKENIYISLDGGQSWTIQATASNYLWDLFCLDERNLYACGVQIIMKSNDGGLNWSTTNFNSYMVDLNSIFFTDTLHGWAVGMYDTLYYTVDGGDNWNAVSIPNYNNGGVYFADQNNGWIGGDNILHSTDGGLTWEIQFQGGLNTNAIYFSDLQRGWFIDHYGTIYHTDNGGENWINQLHYSGYFFEMSFTDSLHAWAIGYEGVVWHTNNGGLEWVKSYIPTLNWFHSVFALDSSHAWISGESGTLLFNDDDNGGSLTLTKSHEKPQTGLCKNPGSKGFTSILDLHPYDNLKASIRIYDLQGRLICQKDEQNISIDNPEGYFLKENLNRGIYIIRILKDNQIFTKKILVQ